MLTADRRDLERRARHHAALGDAARLMIVDELAVGDRTPSELADRLGMARNLLAHHLDVLEAAGMIGRGVSAGDRRRRYVRLMVGPVFPRTPAPARALFVCTHNSARSQLAAVLWDDLTGGSATSAGTHPAESVHPGAVAAARRCGLNLEGRRPAMLSSTIDADVVVTVCDRAREELPAHPEWWHWSVPDPVDVGDDAAFDATISDLTHRIRSLPFEELR